MNNTDTKIKEALLRFREKFPNLFDVYHDREIPGSFSEGENVEQFLKSELSQIAKESEELVQLIQSFIESDDAYESDFVAFDIHKGRHVSEREKSLSRVISKIYQAVHPIGSTCKHPEWERETKKQIEVLKQSKERKV